MAQGTPTLSGTVDDGGFAGALLPALRFAARDDFRALTRLRGLAGLVEAAARTAGARADQAVVAAARAAAHGFDEASADDKRARVQRLLALLEAPRSTALPTAAPPTAALPSAPARPAPRARKQSAPAVDALAFPVSSLRGIGPRRAAELGARGLATVGDLLFTLPRTYEDRRAVRRIAELVPGGVAVVSGTVVASSAIGFGARGRRYEVSLDDGSGVVRLVFFHYRLPEMQQRFARGALVTAAGEVTERQGLLQMVHPKVAAGERTATLGGVHPVYPEIGGLHPLALGAAVQAALERARAAGVPDPLPERLRRAAGVIDLLPALELLHAPKDEVDEAALAELIERRSAGHKRLAFEELFVLGTALALRRRAAHVEPAPAAAMVGAPGDERAAIARLLPFVPTRAQARCIEEVLAELARPVPMARLLQGDVGSGKTAVAAAACLRVVRAGMQAAVMAPTELLAAQHTATLKRLFAPLGVRVEQLTGGLPAKARRLVAARLANRDVDVVVGTHALLSGDVAFAQLCLCVIDEQHRFGVVQRSVLRGKGPVQDGVQLVPHLLVMTATPIPRSLALTVYGDLSVSVLDELPPGRTPVATRVVRDPSEAHQEIRAALSRNERAFVVFPLIDESEKLDNAAATAGYEELRAELGEQVALVHGRLDAKTRDAAMARFVAGEARVLVSTTVIEVGVDVPEATVMVVRDAERFGLAPLHQLRGRVGRSARPSRCLLVVGRGAGPDARRRLEALERTNDGFTIAEEDLAIRGPGDVLGTRQSGLPSLAFSDFVRHAPLIERARALADELVAADATLSHPDHAGLRRLVFERYAARLALTAAG
ncbi:MAG: ATP-dependent DNA helicase RecG [Deltaproteobacteria bacterium]|nr:ATP-dependent DNA helicase RecG [Deltaproteobacteria bacterium]